MWIILSILAALVNTAMTMIVGVGDLKGATALGFVFGNAIMAPLAIAGIWAAFPSHRNMKSFLKAFFWVSVISALTKLAKLGQMLEQNAG